MKTRNPQPSDTQINIALEWLYLNEGENGEFEACKAVAKWIISIQTDAILKSSARRHRLPVDAVRKAWEQRQKDKES